MKVLNINFVKICSFLEMSILINTTFFEVVNCSVNLYYTHICLTKFCQNDRLFA